MTKERFDVVITGGLGRLGTPLAAAARDQGQRVLVLDRLAAAPPPGVEAEVLNLRDIGDLRNLKVKTSSLVHLAAIPSPRLASPEEVFENNVLTTFNILEVARDWGALTVVLASSEAVYGFAFGNARPSPAYLPVAEDHPLEATDPYGLSKIVSEDLCRAHVRRGDCERAIALRFAWILDRNDQVSAVEQLELNVARGISNMFAYLDLRDAIAAVLRSLETTRVGFSSYVVAAPDTLSRLPTEALVATHFPNSMWKGGLYPFGSLVRSSRIENIGFMPRLSWRETCASPT